MILRYCLKKICAPLVVCLIIVIFTSCSKEKEDMSTGKQESNNIMQDLSKNIDISGISDDAEMISINNQTADVNLVRTGDDYETYGNIAENTYGDDNLVLVCKDPVYDITYYVNYGKDYYIYRIKDGISELVVQLPAKYLYSRNGSLYFIVDHYGVYKDTEVKSGNVLAYNPRTAKVDIIIDDNVSKMYVYEDAIYYTIENEPQKLGDIYIANIERYFYSFQSEEVSKWLDNATTFYRWKDYFVGYVLEESEPSEELKALGINDNVQITTAMRLIEKEHKEDMMLAGMTITTDIHVVGDNILYMSENTLYAYHIIDGTTQVIAKDMKAHRSYFIHENHIYQGDSIYDLTTGAKTPVSISEEGKEVLWFYTDGIKMYALVKEINSSDKIYLQQVDFNVSELGMDVMTFLPMASD